MLSQLISLDKNQTQSSSGAFLHHNSQSHQRSHVDGNYFWLSLQEIFQDHEISQKGCAIDYGNQWRICT